MIDWQILEILIMCIYSVPSCTSQIKQLHLYDQHFWGIVSLQWLDFPVVLTGGKKHNKHMDVQR